MRLVARTARRFVLGVAVAVSAAGCATSSTAVDTADLARSLANDNAAAVSRFVEKGRAALKASAEDPAFVNYVKAPGDRATKIASNPGVEVGRALRYMDSFLPVAGASSFVERGGAEAVKLVSSEVVPREQLATDQRTAGWFGPTLDLGPGDVLRAEPYVSADTHELVFSLSTPIAFDSRNEGMVRVEVPLTVLRTVLQRPLGTALEVQLVDAPAGHRLVSTNRATPMSMAEEVPYQSLVEKSTARGTTVIDGRTYAFAAVAQLDTDAGRWFVLVGPIG